VKFDERWIRHAEVLMAAGVIIVLLAVWLISRFAS
jgi:hypothetical protein